MTKHELKAVKFIHEEDVTGGYLLRRPYSPQKLGFNCKENPEFSPAKCPLQIS